MAYDAAGHAGQSPCVPSGGFAMTSSLARRDFLLAGLAAAIAAAGTSGFPAQLYAESACEFLAHHMIHLYSSRSTPLPRWIGGLSGRESAAISGMRNAAIVHLTKALSDQLGPSGIRVNLVHPGTTRTERSAPMYAEQARREGVTVEEIERRIAQNIAIRRIVEAREIGYVVTFLASPKSTAITGEVIAAGGGSMRAVFQ
jgi:NAD(P)-dependent dehydrogenase (short-subunit alcohol dehydrogenase family)